MWGGLSETVLKSSIIVTKYKFIRVEKAVSNSWNDNNVGYRVFQKNEDYCKWYWCKWETSVTDCLLVNSDMSKIFLVL